MTKRRAEMRMSLAGREMSTRLRNVLLNLSEYWDFPNWGALIEAYREDPDEMDKTILRTPGAGRKSLNELKAMIEPELRGMTQCGDTVFLNGEDVQRIRDTIAEACTHCPEGVCTDLRAIEAFFTASTIRTRLPGG